MADMTSRERIVAALEGKPVDRVPWSPFLAYVWENFPAEIQEMGQPTFLHEVGADPMWRGAECAAKAVQQGVETENFDEGDLRVTRFNTPVGSIRWGYKSSERGNTAFLVEHPLKREEDFKVQLWMEEHTEIVPADPGPVEEALALEGLAVGMLVPRGKTAFQSLIEHYVGTEEMAYAMADYPESVEALVQVMTERNLEACRISVESGYDYFITWEDSSTQNYSPAMYERFIFPEIKAYCDTLGPAGKSYLQHACGHVKGLLPMMKACGVKAVESISTLPTGNVTHQEARDVLGKEVGIVGGIEPTNFLNLSMTELEDYVRNVIDICSTGPFVLANSDSCPPGVTMEKFKLVGQVVRDYRP